MQSATMRETLLQIEALQETNQQLAQLERDASALDLDVRNQEHIVQENKRRAKQTHQQRLEAAKNADATQLQIEQAEQEIVRFSVQLNSVRQQHQLDAIQAAILTRRADIQRWEDQGLFSLQDVDDLRGQEEALTEEIRQAEEELERVRTEVHSRKGEHQRRIEELSRERDHIRQQVRPGVLSAYERLLGHSRSHPLARVRDRICRGCFTRVTKQTENLLMHAEGIVYCHSCGRMLMLDEGSGGGA